MANSKKSGDLFTTPVGTAIWTNVRKPDQKYGKFGLSLRLDKDDKAASDLAKKLNTMHEEAGGSVKRQPAKDGAKMRNRDDEPYEGFENNIVLKFGSKFPIATIVDANNQPVPANVDVFSGDRIQVAGVPYNHGEGVTLKVNAIRIIEKNAGSSKIDASAAFGAAVEGYTAPEQTEDDAPIADDNGDF